MKNLSKGFVAALVVASAAALVVPSLPAAASHNAALTVQVGGHFAVGANCNLETFRGCQDAESMRFHSPNLRVHNGDTLTFDLQGFHTATFLPANTDLFQWIQGNTPGISSPYSVLVPDPDDTSRDGGASDRPSTKANPAVAFPTDASCGSTDNPCAYNRTLLNSGVPQGEGPATFSAQVNGNVGDSIWVICLIHPHMFFRLTVVANDAATSTQGEIDGARAANLAADEEWAESQHEKLINQQSSHVTSSGQRVYDVYVGVDNHRTSINAMYPRVATVPKGATVRFNFNELIYEQHTATMSFREGLERGQDFLAPWCDPDGDSGSAADDPPGEGPPCGGDVSKLEFDASSPLFNVAGDGVFTGNDDYENSGVRGGLQFSLAPWDMRFTTASSKKGWKYFCVVHGAGMSGRIKVK